ncbi:MAG: thiamine-phosphate kinase [Phycisphaeraceae bacterium]
MREFDLIRTITGNNASLPGAVTIPPGDDMAAIRLGDRQLLVAVDQIIDQVHFDRAQASLEQIGRKAVTRNLSDVAAMAGKPLATLAAVALPRRMKTTDAERLLDAIRQTAEHYGCPVIGGDTGTHDGPLTLSVTILAEPAGIEPVLRSGAQIGDAIYVTGQLGGSCFEYEGRVHHLDFEPRVELARQLAAHPDTRPTAMIDLSDGLARDLPHLVAGAEVQAHALPVSAVARQRALRDAKPGWLHAVADGEDYELLFAAKADAPIPPKIDGVRITRVGRVVEAPGIVLIQGPERTAIDGLGWEHHG